MKSRFRPSGTGAILRAKSVREHTLKVAEIQTSRKEISLLSKFHDFQSACLMMYLLVAP